MDLSELSAPLEVFGRQAQFQQITQVLAQDGDLLIAGVPGSGRRALVRRAAAAVGAKVIDVDCIRATDGQRLVQLICEGISQAVKSQVAIDFLRQWITGEASKPRIHPETSFIARWKPARGDRRFAAQGIDLWIGDGL
jgi:hypothetical protein